MVLFLLPVYKRFCYNLCKLAKWIKSICKIYVSPCTCRNWVWRKPSHLKQQSSGTIQTQCLAQDISHFIIHSPGFGRVHHSISYNLNSRLPYLLDWCSPTICKCAKHLSKGWFLPVSPYSTREFFWPFIQNRDKHVYQLVLKFVHICFLMIYV